MSTRWQGNCQACAMIHRLQWSARRPLVKENSCRQIQVLHGGRGGMSLGGFGGSGLEMAPETMTVAASRYAHGVSGNTLSWKNIYIYIIIKIFLFIYL